MLATLLGAQPILTLALMGSASTRSRVAGLLALAGLIMVVFQSIALARYSAAGIGFALAALLSMTAGAILQKRASRPWT